MSADAYHLTAPHPEGLGARKSMSDAINDAGLKPEDIDLVNTHGTSTPVGDVAELNGHQGHLRRPCVQDEHQRYEIDDRPPVGRCRCDRGSGLHPGADQRHVAPTTNNENLDPQIDPKLNLTLNKAQQRDVKCALSNTFGFGGHNSTVILKKI